VKKHSKLIIFLVVVIFGSAFFLFKNTPLETYSSSFVCPTPNIPNRLSWIKGERISDIKKLEEKENSRYSGFIGGEAAMNCRPQAYKTKLYLL